MNYEDYIRKHKSQRNWAIAIVFILLIAILFIIFYGKPVKEMFKDDSIIKSDRDSTKKLDKAVLIEIQSINKKIDSQTAYLILVKNEITQLKEKISKTNKSFDEKRTNYISLPFDKRFLLFSGVISKIDTPSVR